MSKGRKIVKVKLLLIGHSKINKNYDKMTSGRYICPLISPNIQKICKDRSGVSYRQVNLCLNYDYNHSDPDLSMHNFVKSVQRQGWNMTIDLHLLV